MHALSFVAQQFRSFHWKVGFLSQARFHSIFSLWQTLVLFSRSFIPTSRGCLATFPMERTQKRRQVRHLSCLHRLYIQVWKLSPHQGDQPMGPLLTALPSAWPVPANHPSKTLQNPLTCPSSLNLFLQFIKHEYHLQ